MTTVGILGVVHDHDLRQKYNLTLDFIKELILEFNPTCVVGADHNHALFEGLVLEKEIRLVYPLRK